MLYAYRGVKSAYYGEHNSNQSSLMAAGCQKKAFALLALRSIKYCSYDIPPEFTAHSSKVRCSVSDCALNQLMKGGEVVTASDGVHREIVSFRKFFGLSLMVFVI